MKAKPNPGCFRMDCFAHGRSNIASSTRSQKSHTASEDFRRVYLGVAEIDRNYPGTGIIDRFLSDLVSRKHKLRIKVRPGELQQVASLLLMLPTLRAKSLPKVLAILEALMRLVQNEITNEIIGRHISNWYQDLAKREKENSYTLLWLAYFLRANGMKHLLMAHPCNPKDPIAGSTYFDQFSVFDKHTKGMFTTVQKASKTTSLLEHLAIFDRSQLKQDWNDDVLMQTLSKGR